MSPGGTVVPDGLFHFGSRPHHPSQTVILYIELIIDVCPILYHVSYIIHTTPTSRLFYLDTYLLTSMVYVTYEDTRDMIGDALPGLTAHDM